jgi:hypothetical protein
MKFQVKSKLHNNEEISIEIKNVQVAMQDNLIGFKAGGGGMISVPTPEGHVMSIRYEATEKNGHKFIGEFAAPYLPSSKKEILDYVKEELEKNHPEFNKEK